MPVDIFDIDPKDEHDRRPDDYGGYPTTGGEIMGLVLLILFTVAVGLLSHMHR